MGQAYWLSGYCMITGIYLVCCLIVFPLVVAVERTLNMVHHQIQRTSAWNAGLLLLTFHSFNFIVLTFQRWHSFV